LHVTREKLPKRLSYKKGARKTLMTLTPDVIVENDDFSSLMVKKEGSPSPNLLTELFEDQVLLRTIF
jgi:hypothetical protein